MIQGNPFADLIPQRNSGVPSLAGDNPFADLISQGEASAAPQPQSPDVAAAKDNHLKGILRSIEQGLTFGFGDEINAGARSAMGGEDYSSALADERAKLDAYRSEHPYLSYGSEVLSGAALPMGAAAEMLRGGVTAGKLLKSATATGAGTGALYGFGSGERDFGSRLENAIQDAVIGAAAANVIPPAINAMGRVGRTVGDAIQNVRNPEASAARAVSDALAQSKLTTADLAPHLQERTDPASFDPAQSGVNFNIIDAARAAAIDQARPGASMPVTNLARNVTGTGGEAEQRAAEALEARQAGQPDRLTDVFSKAVDGADVPATVKTLDATLQNQAQQAYGRAHQVEQPYDILPAVRQYADDNAELLKTNSDLGNTMRKALGLFTQRADQATGEEAGSALPAAGSTISAKDYQALLQKMGVAAETKPEAGQPIQGLKQYLAVRQSLDNMISKSLKPGDIPTPLTAKLTELRNAADQTVKKTNFELAHADNLYSGLKTAQDVIDLGQKAILRAGPAQDAALRRFATMTPAQKELFRIGVSQNARNAVSNLADGSTVAAKQFNRDSFRNFINTVFPPDRAQYLLSELNREGISTRTFTDVFGGSRTAPLAHGIEGLAEDANIAGQAAALNFKGLLQSVGQKIGRQYNAERATQIIKMLTTYGPKSLEPIMEQISKAEAARGVRLSNDQRMAAILQGLNSRAFLRQQDRGAQ